jgi:hypothetical protein
MTVLCLLALQGHLPAVELRRQTTPQEPPAKSRTKCKYFLEVAFTGGQILRHTALPD